MTVDPSLAARLREVLSDEQLEKIHNQAECAAEFAYYHDDFNRSTRNLARLHKWRELLEPVLSSLLQEQQREIREALETLSKTLEAHGISWNVEGLEDHEGQPMWLWDDDGDPREDHPFIQGQCLMRKMAAQTVRDVLSRLSSSSSPAAQEK